MLGGPDNDELTGGAGKDTFVWHLADANSSTVPVDVIKDFDLAPAASGGDILDLRDLLQGESATAATLDNYLSFQKVGSDTVIHVSPVNGGAEGQTIVLEGVDLVTGFANDQAIIQHLLDNGKLITD